jgi:hypothetical protein
LWQERLCGELVRALKSRVKGVENLSSIIEQQQCLAFAEKFNLINVSPPDCRDEYCAPDYDPKFAFFNLKKKNYRPKDTEIEALKGYYKAKYDIPQGVGELREMNTIVEFWGGFRNDAIISSANEGSMEIPPA